MRMLVLVLAILAGLKVAYQEYVYRSVTAEVIITAYRDRALEACRTHAWGKAVTADAWANPLSMTLSVGRSTLGSDAFQLDHAQWNARFKNPYLLITAGDGTAEITCEFDIVNSVAAAQRR
ncbi:MAG TPA: hypothetical protein PK264_13625 [Hyphomicrobiaceae bacterium]|nr:hypothetical protein [Hyphomicrobiaceae bacterium]